MIRVKINLAQMLTEELSDMLCTYVPNNQIISFQIFKLHIFDCDEIIDGKPSPCLYSIYCEEHDELYVYFIDDPSTKRLQSHEDDTLLMIRNEDKLNALLFSYKIAK
ncbi:744_t:CDS:2 [Rhizophagus irregularis]|nr:744_t:CDS:2 [Rhizophagus irregularis]